MLTAFPKIFAIGTDYIKDIFEEEVEITEKLDGCVSLDSKILLSDLRIQIPSLSKKLIFSITQFEQ